MIQNRRFVTGKEMFRDVGNRKTVSSLLYKYSRRNSIVRIRRNVYLPTNPVDGFVDVWNRIYLSSAKRFRPFEFEFVEYMYAPDRHREGIVRPAEHVSVRVTDMERTILDCIDRPDLAGGLEELVYNLELIGTVDEDRLLRYLPLYGKSVIYQKTGFILSLFKERMGLGGEFFQTCGEKTGRSVRYLTDKRESRIYIPRWRLYVPQYILSLTENY